MSMSINAMVGCERKCAICKKEFIVHSGWVFKRGVDKRTKYFCSWHCLREFEKRKLKPDERKDAIKKAVKEGKTVKEVSEMFGVDSSMVNYWKKKLERDENNDQVLPETETKGKGV